MTEAVHLRVTFPRAATSAELTAALRGLTGLLPPWWRRIFHRPSVVLEVRATPSGIEHVITTDGAQVSFVVGEFAAGLPGLRFEVLSRAPVVVAPRLARELGVRGRGLLRAVVAEETNASILAALHPLRAGEELLVQYVIAPVGRPIGHVLRDLGLVGPAPTEPPRTGRPAEPELAVAIRLGVSAEGSARAGQLMARLLGSFHPLGTSEARLTRRLTPSAIIARRLRRQTRPTAQASVLHADELAALAGVPLGGPQLPGLMLSGARILAPNAGIPRSGLVLGDTLAPGGKRPVALARDEARRGLHVCAPTGAGKSTLLIGLATQLMAAGEALIVIESKGDLIADLTDRVPATRADDVIVFNPADRACPVGFNLVGGADDGELIVDHVVQQFRTRYGAAGLGPRSEDILRAALLTLAVEPGRFTLCEVEPLLTNPAFRRRLVGKLAEPVLESFWAWFGSLSEPARAEAVAPLANKLRSYTLRSRVRAVIGQSAGLDLSRVLAERKILLVSLAKGLVGEDAAALIGAAMVSRLWTAIMARADRPATERRPAMVVCDEFQDFAALPISFGDAVAQSRGYGVGWVLAHQHLSQLDAKTRAAVLVNCRSRLVMQTSADDAAVFARELAPHVESADLRALGPFEAYATLSVGSAVAPPVSLRTRPAPRSLGTASAVLARSRRLHGTRPEDVDAAIRARVAGARPAAPVGGVRRGS